MRHTWTWILLLFTCTLLAQPGQVNIPRIELMPAQPSPYLLRDWREVSIRYDSFVYDRDKTGQYLPLCFINPSGVNYPGRESFRLHTYVGTNSPFGNEAINVLPSLVGASLVGVDKRDQYGKDWLLMSQDFFNKANGENLYLNAPGASSGHDWWYDMMPNIYFYQLYDLYPDHDPETEYQFVTIADKMAEAVSAMGGREAPWSPAYMNYRAWRFASMEPNAVGVPEPEAAGAFAWLLYNAWHTSGDIRYRKAAEWSIEFLHDWPTNPSYELMLPYGTLTAARMNAELGTDYNVEKMVNWSFDRGFLRGWGTIVGSWGGLSVSGLVGEANDSGNDYAFQMNGVQQAAALVPMVRYDKRFARAIGKWMLHLASATRLFYDGFLPADQQDASAWSSVHDPDAVLGYEAMRQVWQGKSPFSTGDAVNGGWAATNLALYGTSSIGYLGSIVSPTNVDGILKLDVLATDFFGKDAYPTYLYYNSQASPRTIQLQVGGDPVDVYDALTETFLHQQVTGIVPLSIPAGEARLVTLCPAGGKVTYDRHQMLVDGIVVDYDQHAQAYTHAPRIKGLAPLQDPVEILRSTTIQATASDVDSDTLDFTWLASAGTVVGSGPLVTFSAPGTAGDVLVQCVVSDPEGNTDTATVIVHVVLEVNDAPVITRILKASPYVEPGGSVAVTCIADDPDNEPLEYSWTVSGGILNGSGASVEWNLPGTPGIYEIAVTVTDDHGLSDASNTTMLVHVFGEGDASVIARYPFNGNPQDASGNNLHGQANGALLTSDRFGNPQQAYWFPGGSQNISVANSPLLNVQDAITVSCWFQARELPERENFILSHGSWQNRWKISVTPERKLRWTVNTLSAIGDLDMPEPLATDSFYHVVATYKDGLMAMYLNGQLAAYRPLNGMMRTASVPFLMGQMLPGETAYNFNGVIDEVIISHGAMVPDAVASLYESSATSLGRAGTEDFEPCAIAPNPAVEATWVTAAFDITQASLADLEGRVMARQEFSPGRKQRLHLADLPGGIYLVTVSGEGRSATGRLVKR